MEPRDNGERLGEDYILTYHRVFTTTLPHKIIHVTCVQLYTRDERETRSNRGSYSYTRT